MVNSKNIHIHYTLSMPDPSSHILKIETEFSGISDDYLDVKLPVWRPGRYLVFEFASGLMNFQATNDKSERLQWNKLDK